MPGRRIISEEESRRCLAAAKAFPRRGGCLGAGAWRRRALARLLAGEPQAPHQRRRVVKRTTYRCRDCGERTTPRSAQRAEAEVAAASAAALPVDALEAGCAEGAGAGAAGSAGATDARLVGLARASALAAVRGIGRERDAPAGALGERRRARAAHAHRARHVAVHRARAAALVVAGEVQQPVASSAGDEGQRQRGACGEASHLHGPPHSPRKATSGRPLGCARPVDTGRSRPATAWTHTSRAGPPRTAEHSPRVVCTRRKLQGPSEHMESRGTAGWPAC